MASVLIIIGVIIAFIGGILFLIVAFSESVLWGLGCIFVPFVGLIFLITHWGDAKGPFFIQLAGGVVIVLGALVGGI